MTNGSVPEQKRKGLHPLAWVAIGCAGILVVGAIVAVFTGMFLFGKAKELAREMEDKPALATAKLIAAANPDIELLGEDEANQTVTFRNVQTGEEFTFGYKDIQEGKITFTSGKETASIDFDGGKEGEGKMTITTDRGTATVGAGVGVESFPDWLPVYPDTTPQGTYATDNQEMRGGAYTIRTEDGLEEVIAFYAARLEEAGLAIAHRTTTPQGAILVATAPDESRSSTVTASVEKEGTQVMVNFAEKK